MWSSFHAIAFIIGTRKLNDTIMGKFLYPWWITNKQIHLSTFRLGTLSISNFISNKIICCFYSAILLFIKPSTYSHFLCHYLLNIFPLLNILVTASSDAIWSHFTSLLCHHLQEMFGRQPPDDETQSEDEDWGPKMRKRRRVGTSIDICMTNCVCEDVCSHLGPINKLSSNKKRQIFRIPPEAVEVISIAFWKIFYYVFCSFASLDLFVAVGKKYYYTNTIVISIENLRIISCRSHCLE